MLRISHKLKAGRASPYCASSSFFGSN